MMKLYLLFSLALMGALLMPSSAGALDKTAAYELHYSEQETGTDIYDVRVLVSGTMMRIDDPGSDDNGYIIFDNDKKTIFSVSHYDKSILVIPLYSYARPDMSKEIKIENTALTDAPKIAGKTVHSYSAFSGENKCLAVQYVPGLLPEVVEVLRDYQLVLSGQQVKNLPATPKEYQTPCFLYDQVYNDGEYLLKGLPVHEWYSSGKTRLLNSYREIMVEPDVYRLPEGYREFSLN